MVAVPGDFNGQKVLTLPLANISSTVTVCTQPDGGSGRLGVFFVLQPSVQARNITATTVNLQQVDSVINAYSFTGEWLVAPSLRPTCC